MTGLRVLFAEDDSLTRILATEIMTSAGHFVESVGSVSAALALSAVNDYHVVVSDLNFGSGPTGVDLLKEVCEAQPWIGAVVLSSQASPQLIADNAADLPDHVVYLIKSELRNTRSLLTAIEGAIQMPKRGAVITKVDPLDDANFIRVTRIQAALLSMLGRGYSFSRIARARGTSVRAVEMLAWRLYDTLGVSGRDDVDPRTAAVSLWHSGRVVPSTGRWAGGSRRRTRKVAGAPVMHEID